MLNSAFCSARSFQRITKSLRACTSDRRIWRPSGRGCTVIPYAPYFKILAASASTSGAFFPRALRIVASLLTLTLRRVMGHPVSQEAGKNMTKTLVLCRHAHRDNSRRELDNGLTDKGREQAKNIRRFFGDRFAA